MSFGENLLANTGNISTNISESREMILYIRCWPQKLTDKNKPKMFLNARSSNVLRAHLKGLNRHTMSSLKRASQSALTN